jgi:hypothetical protein
MQSRPQHSSNQFRYILKQALHLYWWRSQISVRVCSPTSTIYRFWSRASAEMRFNGCLDTARITGELCRSFYSGARITMLVRAAFCACHLRLGPDPTALGS